MFIPIPRIVVLFLAPCTGIFLACSPWAVPEKEAPGLRVFFVDVGQGDACALRTPEGKWYLNDVGNDERALIAFLRHVRADTLQAIVLSHTDLDHFGALPAVLHAFPVKKVFLPEGTRSDSAWLEAMRALDVSGADKATLFEGDTLLWDAVRVRALWPAPRATYSGNDLSTVLRVESAGMRILLTGDIEDPVERIILSDHPDLAADILKVAHHGSRTSSGLGFIEAVHPRWAVISCDSSVYGHPHAEALADLRWVMEDGASGDEASGDDARILRTDREGTIAFELGEWGVRRIEPWE
ncbi:MAG: MBL fold metallo-hydrolase [Fibrobacteres bacterium]|nr:MBL fold metallo-hydrolase [Fibrobacterota bacterium]